MTPAPFVRETSQYAALVEPHEDRHACPCAACTAHRAMHYGYDQRPGVTETWRPWIIGALLMAIIILVGFAVLWSVPAHARATQVQPIKAPAALTRARAACPATTTIVECRGKLREAYAGLEWAKKERAHTYAPTVAYAIRLACTSQPTVDCAWLTRMIHCESGGDPHNKNAHSTASGLAQFLDGTWSGNPYGRFDVFDPIANALGAAWLAARSGHAPWYESRGCWA